MPQTTQPPQSSAAGAPPSGGAVRRLGRFQLLRLLGKTAHAMQWLVAEGDEARGNARELVLVMPRHRLEDPAEMDAWLAEARQASRVQHPALLVPVEVGQQERYPYVAYARETTTLWTERLSAHGETIADVVPAFAQLLEGLAFAHESGLVHRDLHAGMVAVGEDGQLSWLGLGALGPAAGEGHGLVARRLAAERDVLAAGLVLHQALAGRPALDEPDAMAVADRMAPKGHELVRLPFTDVQPIPEPLRAIVNRATDRQPRQRYRSARTFARALQGWLRASGDAQGGPLVLFMDRMRQIGLLPAAPGAVQSAQRLNRMDSARSEDLADEVLADVGVAFEMLRAVNVAQQRVGAVAGNGPILTVRRGIEMLGLRGVLRAAKALRPWPGPLNEAQAADLAHQLELARLAGNVARWLRPAGYDGELVYLLALMQRLGRLVAQYHFPDEAVQIRRLMLPLPPAREGDSEEPGMAEQAAAYAVLGVDLDALTMAIGRYWGLDEDALHLLRRQPADSPVHPPQTDAEVLRLVASLANEVVDARHGPAHRRHAALAHVAQRYGRSLQVTHKDILACAEGQPPEDQRPDADASGAPDGAAVSA